MMFDRLDNVVLFHIMKFIRFTDYCSMVEVGVVSWNKLYIDITGSNTMWEYFNNFYNLEITKMLLNSDAVLSNRFVILTLYDLMDSYWSYIQPNIYTSTPNVVTDYTLHSLVINSELELTKINLPIDRIIWNPRTNKFVLDNIDILYDYRVEFDVSPFIKTNIGKTTDKKILQEINRLLLIAIRDFKFYEKNDFICDKSKFNFTNEIKEFMANTNNSDYYLQRWDSRDDWIDPEYPDMNYYNKGNDDCCILSFLDITHRHYEAVDQNSNNYYGENPYIVIYE
jgi:hypothetical protein